MRYECYQQSVCFFIDELPFRCILGAATTVAELRDGDAPIRFTPHDFRRLFSTEAVGAGLPLHIVAALLGHLDLDTTRSYTNSRELHQAGAFLQVA